MQHGEGADGIAAADMGIDRADRRSGQPDRLEDQQRSEGAELGIGIGCRASAAARSPSTSLKTALAGVSAISMRDDAGLIQAGVAGFPGGWFLGVLLIIGPARGQPPILHGSPANRSGANFRDFPAETVIIYPIWDFNGEANPG